MATVKIALPPASFIPAASNGAQFKGERRVELSG